MDENEKKTPAKKRAPAKKAETEQVAPQVPKKIQRPHFDRFDEIRVVSQCPGELHFVSKRTGSEVVWSEAGDDFPLTFEELTEMRNSQKKFFERNWIILPDDVIAALGVGKYYSGSLSPEEYETVFDLPITEMTEKLKSLPDGQKRTLAYRASMLNNDGAIDSKSRIKAIEESLDVQLDY